MCLFFEVYEGCMNDFVNDISNGAVLMISKLEGVQCGQDCVYRHYVL